MAFFRRTFSRRMLPDRFQEISERVYVFDCCLSTKELSEQDFKSYMDNAVANLQKYHPGASFMVFNFKEGEEPSLLSDILSQHEMTVVDYPRHYEGYPILPLEMIHYCLRSSESWLSLEGQRNVILMHCERGGWPALAFMLAGLLLYNKKQNDEQKALEIVYKQAPKELLTQLSMINPRSSELRYLKYISRRSLTSDWPPSDSPLAIESLLLMNLPLFDGGKGCRPVIHIYGQDPSVRNNRSPRLLFSSLMSDQGARYYDKEECLLVKINVDCRVQGDIFLECIHLGEDLVSEEKVFKVMFHTAFIQSYILVLSSSEVDVLWNANSKIPNDFKAEVFFANPEEVQLKIAKEVKSAEQGHESENEFFEAEEFDSSASQAHRNYNLISREIVEVESNDGKEIHLDHHHEDKQENKDGPVLDHFNDNLMSPEGVEDTHLDHHNIEGKQENIDDNVMSLEGLVVEINDVNETSHANFVVEGTHLDHHSEDKQERIDSSSVISVAVVEDILKPDPEAIFDEIAAKDEYNLSQGWSSEQALEVDYMPSWDTNDEKDSDLDTHASVEGNYTLYENEANVANVDDISDAEVDYETRGTEIASIHLDLVTRSQEDASETTSSQAIYETIVVAQEFTEDGSSSSSLEAKKEINDAIKDFHVTEIASIHLDLVTRSQEDASETVSSQAISETIVVAQEGFTEGGSSSTSLEAKKEINDASNNFLVEESQEDSSSSSFLEAKKEINDEIKVFLVEESQEDTSKATFSETQLGGGQDYSEARSEADIVSKNILVKAREDEPKAALPEYKARINNESNNFLIEDNIKASLLEAIFEPDVAIKSITSRDFVVEESQEDSSKAPSSETLLGGGQDYSEARSEPDIVSTNIVVEASEDEPKAALPESKAMIINNESNNFLIEESQEDSSKPPFPDYSEASPLEAIFEPDVAINNTVSRDFVVEEIQEDSSKAPSSEARLGGIQDYSKATPLEAVFEPNIVFDESDDEPNVAPLVSKTRLSHESNNFLIEESSKAPFSEDQLGGDEDYSKASSLEAIFEPNIASKNEESEDEPKGGPSESKMRLNNESDNFLTEESQEDSFLALLGGSQDYSKTSPLEAIFEPKILVQGSEDKPKVAPKEFESDPIIASNNIVVSKGSEETNILLEGGQDIVEATCSEAGLELKKAGENREEGSRAGSEVVEGSDQDSSEISSSEIEPEIYTESQSFMSIEGSEDYSASEAGSELNDQANNSIHVSSEAGSEVSNTASKHIVVVIEDNKEQEVKVQVQTKAEEGGSKGVLQKQLSKKKLRLADAVAKVTVQKRVVSMWVPRAKQPTPDDSNQKPPLYKWIPKESVSSTSEEA